MLANGYGIFPLTGRAHCQRQVAFFLYVSVSDYFGTRQIIFDNNITEKKSGGNHFLYQGRGQISL